MDTGTNLTLSALLLQAAMLLLRIAGIVIVCAILIKLSKKLTKAFFGKRSALSRTGLNEQKRITLKSIVDNLAKYLIYFLGLFAILKMLGVSDSSLVVVTSAFSVAIGLGAQGVVTDMLAGFFALFEDQFAVGDLVTIQNITGTVEGISLRSTRVRDAKGAVHIIPNGSLGIVTNMSKEYINAIVDIGISYEADTDRVKNILTDELQKAADIPDLLEAPTFSGILSLDDSAVTYRIVAKCKVKTSMAVEMELRRRIKNRLDKEGIEIPFPQRTIHIISQSESSK